MGIGVLFFWWDKQESTLNNESIMVYNVLFGLLIIIMGSSTINNMDI